jgi:5-methylcytosine-specific restriction endonuclease McrA
LQEGIKPYCCENCGLSTWLGNPIPLELHHIDGDKTNNTLENFQLLCPNCHALTDSYRGKNVKKKRNKEK